ncbi:hybrid sensor histidine kinase/response regulator [Pseudoduganella umbonata]|uniref:histidine kinase n=1 Tax=Pseudoduganella umbonata TaxID=864828 RepID=A0A4P8HR66_9BURK|nr:ATP-binding protein [Pseudoduganella umbonata]MBB3224789.1 signal transduction histidine kinase/CheY-like chemotaxis protein [Pseudoduganella umbonata]QCP11098.1 response regulator [Pseudoduganella umbonata]
MPIRTRLLLLILSILFPAVVVASVAVWYVYQEQRKAEQAGTKEAVRALSLLADREVLAIEGILRTLAASPALRDGDFRAFHEQARSVAPPQTSTVVIQDLEGRQLLNSRQPFGSTPPQGGSTLRELRQAKGEHGTVVSDLFMAPVGKRPDIAVQIPVHIGGELRYYLAMGMAAERLVPLLVQQGLPPQWTASLVDRQGRVIARSRDAGKYIGMSVRPVLRGRILAGERSGVHQGVTLSGIDTKAFFSRAPLSGWTVILSVPLDEIRRPAIYAATGFAAMIVLMLALSIAGAHWYARRTAAPIERLRRSAEALGAGEAVAALVSGMAEADAVSRALADAGARIRGNEAELERKVAEAVAAAERAQRALLQGQKLEALGRLTAGIAHDFNNVLQTLSGALQLIPLTQDRARVQALAETCQRAIVRATTLTGQMRSFGTVQDARLATVDPATAVHNVLPMLKNALPDNVDLVLDLQQVPEAPWPVTIDPLQMELALLNLVINARDAMPAGGRVSVALRNEALPVAGQGQTADLAPGDYLRLSVTDTGTGMSQDTLAHALEPFYTTKGVDKGTGLGLPQAYGFAVQSNGKLVLDSTPGAGTTVTVWLPRAAGAAAAADDAGRAAPPELQPAEGMVLFVEDDPLVRETMLAALATAGFEVRAAASGDEALAVLESGAPVRQVFSDIVMPGAIGGVELARIVLTRYPHVRIVLATGYTDSRVNLPGVRLLAKPYDIAELYQALR